VLALRCGFHSAETCARLSCAAWEFRRWNIGCASRVQRCALKMVVSTGGIPQSVLIREDELIDSTLISADGTKPTSRHVCSNVANFSLPFNWAFRMRFSAAKYSFRARIGRR
jgi:hypothetical protein